MKKLRWAIAQYFEKRWWNNYLKSKDLDEYLHWKATYWKQFLEQLPAEVELKPDGMYLDAGCGPAGINMVLPGTVSAIDPLLGNYASQFTFFKPELYPQVHFEEAALETYRASKPYDVVFCLNVINHVHDIQKALQTLNACCKPSGILVLSVDVHNYKWLSWLFRLSQADVMHPQQLDASSYIKLLETSGFNVIAEQLLKKETIFSYQVFVARKN